MEEKNKQLKSFLTRLTSGLVLIILLVVFLYIGGEALFIVSCFLSIIGLIEINRVLKINESKLSYLSMFLTIVYYITIYNYKVDGVLLFLIIMLLSILTFYVYNHPKYSIKDVSIAIFSILYVAVMFSFVYLIREQRGIFGRRTVWLIFIASWGSDTCAYVVGKLFGKHKLTPILSPKKTVEGAIGGVVGSFLLGALYAYVVFHTWPAGEGVEISMIRFGIASALGAIISQIGDLTASAIKREYGVKDYGDIIPGHGGILDRFDSVIFAAPALYFILRIYR